MKLSGETFQGKPMYLEGRASIFWDGRGKWVASDGYVVLPGATAEEAAQRYREHRRDIHGE